MRCNSWRGWGIRIVAACVLAGCQPRIGPPPTALDPRAAEAMERFVAFSLDPARLPPPSLDPEVELEVDGVSARARLVRAEEASWNSWPGPRMRLFNHRWAWVVALRLEGEGAIGWVPEGTTLELNDPDTVLSPATHPDEVLSDLLFWALQQERADLGDELAARLRAAGPFRAAYLPSTGEDVLEGLLAFPAGDAAELHVVAARLTVGVEVEGEPSELVFVFP